MVISGLFYFTFLCLPQTHLRWPSKTSHLLAETSITNNYNLRVLRLFSIGFQDVSLLYSSVETSLFLSFTFIEWFLLEIKTPKQQSQYKNGNKETTEKVPLITFLRKLE